MAIIIACHFKSVKLSHIEGRQTHTQIFYYGVNKLDYWTQTFDAEPNHFYKSYLKRRYINERG